MSSSNLVRFPISGPFPTPVYFQYSSQRNPNRHVRSGHFSAQIHQRLSTSLKVQAELFQWPAMSCMLSSPYLSDLISYSPPCLVSFNYWLVQK